MYYGATRGLHDPRAYWSSLRDYKRYVDRAPCFTAVPFIRKQPGYSGTAIAGDRADLILPNVDLRLESERSRGSRVDASFSPNDPTFARSRLLKRVKLIEDAIAMI